MCILFVRRMLLEGELLLLGGAGLLRVWSCMAQDLAKRTGGEVWDADSARHFI